MYRLFPLLKINSSNIKPLRQHMLEHVEASSVEWIAGCTHLAIQVVFSSHNSSKYSCSKGKRQHLGTAAQFYSWVSKAFRLFGAFKKTLYIHTGPHPSFRCSAFKAKVLTELTNSLRTSIKTSTFQVWACAPSLLSFPSLQIPLPGAEIDCK